MLGVRYKDFSGKGKMIETIFWINTDLSKYFLYYISFQVLLVESGILACFGIQNTAQEIRNPTDDWNPESKFHWQRIRDSVPGIPKSRGQDYTLDSLTRGKRVK